MNDTTGSRATRILGATALVSLAIALLFGLVLSPPEVAQRDAVRLMYIHLPTIAVAYSGYAITLVASALYLRNGSMFWDLVAGAAAEIAVLFTAFLLISGALWGKPTWGVYWQWDPRLTSTTVMFIMYLGYLALRRLELPAEVRSRRAAILGVISFVNVIIVHYSVRWWRGLHQGQTLGIDTKLDGLMLFSLFLSLVAFMLVGAWLLIHRFRVAWLERQIEVLGFEQALRERRGEASGFGSIGGAI
ncbi:MAG: cytochrome c biogenesis protein [Acidimicrobiales bacterium]